MWKPVGNLYYDSIVANEKTIYVSGNFPESEERI